MNKKTAIKRLIFIILVTIIGICLSIFSFPILGTTYDFNGFANSIKLGLDLKGGVVAVYDCSEIEGMEGSLDDKIDATVLRLGELLTSKGYTEAVVTRQGTNQIRVEVPDVDNSKVLLDMIGEPALLEFKENQDDKEAKLTGSHVQSVEAGYQQGEWGVSIKFNSEGTVIFAEMTEKAYNNNNAPIYIYLDGELISQPAVQSVISGGTTFISGSYDQESAEAFALQILSGTYSVSLSLSSSEVVSATLSDGAITKSLIAGLIGLAIMLIVIVLLYKDLGLLASLALIINAVLMIFFLMAVPYVQLTLPGIAGIILSLGMAVDGSVIIFERIKEEYASGKKMHNAFNDGFKRSVNAILDGQITTLIAAVVLAILGTGTIKGFAIVLLIGICVSLFTSLVVQRGLLKIYLALNAKNPKRAGLVREEKANEANR